jgi:receptor protein-tyrosine kinase
VDFKDLLQMARRRWRTIAAFFALGIIASAAYCSLATPVYHSTARVFISNDSTSASDAYLASSFATLRVQSYADLANSTALMERVIKRLSLNLTPSELAAKVSASVVEGTVILQVEATDPSARIAQQIAQAEATELTSYLGEIE